MSMNYENEIQNLSGTGGFGGGGFLTGLIFGALFDGGFGNKKSGDCAVENAILNQTIAENTQFANLNNAVTNATYTIENDISQLKDVTSAGFYGINNTLLEAKYDNALQIQNQTNLLSAKIDSGNQEIKDMITCNKISDLERQLAVAQSGGEIARCGRFVEGCGHYPYPYPPVAPTKGV